MADETNNTTIERAATHSAQTRRARLKSGQSSENGKERLAVTPHQIGLALSDAEICGMHARILLEIALEEEPCCQDARLGTLIGTALSQLDQVASSVKATCELVGLNQAA